jgi:hypothetical protein
MSSVDNDTIYFYGHNHQNFQCKNANKMIYADNQIGYENLNIEFKTMTTGLEINPYFHLTDGLYKTSIKDYLQFYNYLGEFIGDGTLLYQRCQNNKASMYVIKRKGYYGFFILNRNTGVISIVNGGKTKRITKSTDLQWLFDNFEIVVSKYLQVLAPIRKVQEQISKELKSLNLSGTIHGFIVDIDFYHHIMLNPMDGTMTYYYSSSYGLAKNFSSFDKVILSMEKEYDNDDFDDELLPFNYDLLQSQFNEMKKTSNFMLGKTNYLLENSSEQLCLTDSFLDELSELEKEEQTVSRKDGMYGLSRKVNVLQRLFSGHVLRDFDLRLTETKPAIDTNVKHHR